MYTHIYNNTYLIHYKFMLPFPFFLPPPGQPLHIIYNNNNNISYIINAIHTYRYSPTQNSCQFTSSYVSSTRDMNYEVNRALLQYQQERNGPTVIFAQTPSILSILRRQVGWVVVVVAELLALVTTCI